MLEVDVKRKQGQFQVDSAFVAQASGVTALFGKSGSGKTSLINMVAGLVRPDLGRITLKGRSLFDASRHICLPPEQRRVGYVFQDGRLFPHLSVYANLTYGMNLVPRNERRILPDQVVDLLGIGHLLKRRPAKLSGGEKQRVAIGRALLTSPLLLLMDEPLASLDEARKMEVLPFINRLARELSIPIVYVSHSLDEILNLADHLILIDDGRVTATGPIEDLMSRLEIRQMMGRYEYGAVMTTVIEAHHEKWGITTLSFAGGDLNVPLLNMPVGSTVRVHINARDVAVALTRPAGISVQNVFAGTIEEISENNGDMVDICMDIGHPLLARITPKARQEMDLKTGQNVYALIKTVSISHGSFPKEEAGPSESLQDHGVADKKRRKI